jgi:hypothetical protein
MALGYIRAEFAAPGQEIMVEPGRAAQTTDRLIARAA